VERAALQSGTPIYSIRVGYLTHSHGFFLTHSEARLHEIDKICHQTGGQLVETRGGTSVGAAMATIFSWLKQGYTLSYSPVNKQKDGAYRTIEVRLTNQREARNQKYDIYARQGYYAPASH
jgi:sigma54-dependent transcription regulator